jgi:hypothetical protein
LSAEWALHVADGMILHAFAPLPLKALKTLCTILVSA